MSRSTTIHPLSLAIGSVVAAVVLISMSQSTAQAPMPLRVEYLAHPKSMVTIWEGTSFTVPAGNRFVLTGLGSDLGWNGGFSNLLSLSINGQAETVESMLTPGAINAGLSIGPVVSGHVAGAGAVVAVSNGDPSRRACALGYLVDSPVTTVGGAAPLVVEFSPNPDSMLEIAEGTSFTVPMGKRLVVTALGGLEPSGTATGLQHALLVGGVQMATHDDTGQWVPMAHLPPGFTVPQGSVVSVVTLSGLPAHARALGYLVDQ